MPPELDEDWRPGCPDCAQLREELDDAHIVAAHFRNENGAARAELRAAVLSYEARLREQAERYQALLAGLRGLLDSATDPMDVYGSAEPRP